MKVSKIIFDWLLMPCVVASIIFFGVIHRKANIQDQARKSAQKQLPPECRKLKLKVCLMREEMLERRKRFVSIFDFMRLTNDTWFAEVKSLISEAQESVDSYLCSIDDMCVDTRIALASSMSSNQWHEARVNSFINDVHNDAKEGFSIFSYDNLRSLERQYNILNKHRSLWRIEEGDFVFLNDGLEWEYVINYIEFPADEDM